MTDEGKDRSVDAAYEALNASYRVMDEYLRQSQRLAERFWGPLAGSWSGPSSPFVPPEPWIRAYGDLAMAWMSMARQWTDAVARWSGAAGPTPATDSRPEGRAAPTSEGGRGG